MATKRKKKLQTATLNNYKFMIMHTKLALTYKVSVFKWYVAFEKKAHKWHCSA